jgi:hypothetical protein
MDKEMTRWTKSYFRKKVVIAQTMYMFYENNIYKYIEKFSAGKKIQFTLKGI